MKRPKNNPRVKEEQQENFRWLQAHRGWFYVLGRAVLKRRRMFVARLEEALRAAVIFA
jgi:hypothetical protein